MANYLVLVSAEEYVNIEADSEKEAADTAKDVVISSSATLNWDATIINPIESDDWFQSE